jgi:hypothetical protein
MMNVGRGLFQAWLVVTILWVVGIGALAYSIVPANISEWKWQYVPRSPAIFSVSPAKPSPRLRDPGRGIVARSPPR